MRPAEGTSSSCVVCAVVVNWNGWRDTIACLESLLALGGTPLRVVVCDNGSTDASPAELERHLRARLPHWEAADGEPGFADLAAGGGVLSVHLLRLSGNLGYAGGINAGIEWARERWTPRGFWLLNNDVQALPGALDAMLAAHASVPDAGICGSVLLEWDEPHRIQGVAGVYRRWLGVGWHDTQLPPDGRAVSLALDYPIGASMYVAADYLDSVGLMDSGYFLYCEEMDWAERGRRRGLRPLVALGSRLRHKEGASTGSGGGVRHKSLLSERYGVVNRLRITRKFWPHWLPAVWFSLSLVVLDRLVHGELARAWLVLRLMLSPSQWLRENARSHERFAKGADLRRIGPDFVASDRQGFAEGSARSRQRSHALAQRCSQLARAHPSGSFHLHRFCLCCKGMMPMLVDYQYGAPEEDGTRTPNWRERLVCPGCGMNNRQRLVASLIHQCAIQHERPRVYLMEQVTPIFRWVAKLDAVEVHGSEYLGHGYRGGEWIRGVRHEDVMNLSYPDDSFELIVSNDVLEHVPDPARALRECFRVLRPNGIVLATFPFHPAEDMTRVRATLAGHVIEHVLAPRYHGNPLSADGSLVFQDFGWDVLETMRAAGFASAHCESYSSDSFGHLGPGLLVFRLRKPQH